MDDNLLKVDALIYHITYNLRRLEHEQVST